MSTDAHAKLVRRLKKSINYHLTYTIGSKDVNSLTQEEQYTALVYAVKELTTDLQLETEARVKDNGTKRVYYLSLEFLIGRLLGNNLHNLGVMKACKDAAESLGFNLSDLFETELDPALGNGGLGRLAACFLDSMATLDIAGYGYGINYEYGLFKQSFVGGQQREQPDHWMMHGAPWQTERPQEAVRIPIYGRVDHTLSSDGEYRPVWVGWRTIVGVPHDMPVVGYGRKTVNYLRLYSARSSDTFDMEIFNQGDYIQAVQQKIQTETVSKVLYPSDSVDAGKELRLIQEYFFVACALRDIVKRHLEDHDIKTLPEHVAIQLNDTHPALAVPDLMRMLMDEHDLSWDEAWHITTNTLAFTNHTLLPEALERWPVDLVEHVLPRHLEIIYEINSRFLDEVKAAYPGDDTRLQKMSIIEETPIRQVRMANLSIIGSHSVNGVAALHTKLLKAGLVPEFNEFYPGKFNNKTNGVTQRRWVMSCNPRLSEAITAVIGDQWVTHLSAMRDLEKLTDDSAFLDLLKSIKHQNKADLSKFIYDTTRVKTDPNSMFDVQIKRIHEYKRQLLNALHIAHLYLSIVEDGAQLHSPRTFIFSGKAAPGYYIAKLIVKFINNLATIINADPRVRDQIRVVFIPDYKVSVAERIIPAADLSEQISTAGYEASGTGNMKLAMNGALTVGTLDGANVEMLEEVGEDNIYIFGLKANEVLDLRAQGYNPYDYYHNDTRLKRLLDAIRNDVFCRGEQGLFIPIYDLLLTAGDFYMNLADFDAYTKIQSQIDVDFLKDNEWQRKSLLNVARMGKFSSDRTIAEYARDIWNVTPGNSFALN